MISNDSYSLTSTYERPPVEGIVHARELPTVPPWRDARVGLASPPRSLPSCERWTPVPRNEKASVLGRRGRDEPVGTVPNPESKSLAW